MSAYLWIAKKSPHSQRLPRKAFGTEKQAREWLESVIDDEPEVEAWSIQENTEGRYPCVVYLVDEGEGKVAGHIDRAENHTND
jgi:endonuclease YncB( thermonuclease family)